MSSIVASVIGWIFRYCVNGVKTPIRFTKDSENRVIERIGTGCCLAGMGITLLRSIVLWIVFIVNEGYSKQFKLLSKMKIDKLVSDESVVGNASELYNGIFFYITMAILAVAIGLTLYCFYRNSVLLGKILFSVSFVIDVGLCVSIMKGLPRMLPGKASDNEMWFGFGILLFSILSLWLLHHYGDEMVTSSSFAIVYGLIIGPALLFAVENIFYLIGMAILIGVMLFIASVVVGGEGSDSSSGSSLPQRTEKASRPKEKKETPCNNAKSIYLGGKPYLGKTIMGDPGIYIKDSITDTEHFQCSKYEFESGKVKLFYNNKRVTSVPGCSRPKN